MRKKILSAITIFLIIFTIPFSAFAHSGKTDASGGHKDNKNKSGLGSYHYHCGGHPAHLHPGGVCPYKSGGTSSSSSSVSSTPKTVYATRVDVPNMPSSIDSGESIKLNGSVYPANAEDKAVSWESSDTTVAAVDSNGNLKAVGVGTAVISAKTSRGTTTKYTLTVNEVVAESIAIQGGRDKIFIGDTAQLSVQFTPENTTYKDVEWKSEDTSIVSVDKNGKLSALRVGKTTVYAIHKELIDSFVIEVMPIKAESIEIEYPIELGENEETKTPRIEADSTLTLTAIILPEDTTDQTIKWSVDNEDIATISNDGVLTGIAKGTVVVTARTENGKEDTIEIEIHKITVFDVVAGAIVFVLGIGLVGTSVFIVIRIVKRRKKKKTIDE